MNRSWLAPLTPLYAAGLALRNMRFECGWTPAKRLRFPVVSVGNLSTGGAGKTPLAIALAQSLVQRGLRVDVLLRGYGRSGRNPARVDPLGAAEEFGDEPLLIAQEAGVPVYVAAERYEAGLLAEAESSLPCIHLLDDGFQHRQLHRDVNILLLNNGDLTDRQLPAGNLREPLRALNRATVLAIPADEPEVECYLRTITPFDRGTDRPRWSGPIWRLRRTMDVPEVDGPAAAFCGIARPEPFFAGLAANGVRIAARFAFRDHHRYTPMDLQRIFAAARAAGATALLSTEKDRVRLGKLAAAFPESLPLKTVRLRVEIEDADAALDGLANLV
jgi:tetraacyldisaccharide 4'-kinase